MDPDHVIERSLNSHNYFKLMPDINQQVNKFFMPSRIKLEDDQFKLFEVFDELRGDDDTMFVEQIRQHELFDPQFKSNLDTKDKKYISVYLRADNKFRIYRRQVETVLDFFGDIGGLGEIVIGFGALCQFLVALNFL